MSTIATVAPSSCIRCAVTRPMPDAPPVTIASSPSRIPMAGILTRRGEAVWPPLVPVQVRPRARLLALAAEHRVLEALQRRDLRGLLGRDLDGLAGRGV